MTVSNTTAANRLHLSLEIFTLLPQTALVSILISVLLCRYMVKQNKTRQTNKTFDFVFSQRAFATQCLCIFLLWHYCKTSRLYLGSLCNPWRTPSLYHISYIIYSLWSNEGSPTVGVTNLRLSCL